MEATSHVIGKRVLENLGGAVVVEVLAEKSTDARLADFRIGQDSPDAFGDFRPGGELALGRGSQEAGIAFSGKRQAERKRRLAG